MKKATVLKRIAIPLLAVVFLQSALLLVTLSAGNVFGKIKEVSCSNFSEQVQHHGMELESNMLNRWSDLKNITEKMNQSYETILKQECMTSGEFSESQEIQKAFLTENAGEMIHTLRQNQVNGIFLILIGNTGMDVPTKGVCTKLGLCIRDLDQTSNFEDTEDLLAERGTTSIVRTLGLALDSEWTALYQFDKETDSRYFYEPIHAAVQNPGINPELLGYWSPMHQLSTHDSPVMSYSIPLIGSSGVVYAVLGVEVTQSYLRSLLIDGDFSDDEFGTLATVSTDGQGYELMNFGDSSASRDLLGGVVRLTEDTKLTADCIRAKEQAADGTPLVFTVQPLSLYPKNSPMPDQQLALIGITSRQKLFALSDQVQIWLWAAMVLSLGIGIIGILTASHVISAPIMRLAANVRKRGEQDSVELEETGILEIDQLIESVNRLNRDVASNQAKLSTILRLADYPVGVFEVDLVSRRVYFSEGIFFVLRGVFQPEEIQRAANLDDFLQLSERLRQCEAEHESENSVVMDLSSLIHTRRWIRVRKKQLEDCVVGVLSDVTEEILQKRKIEYERDYDSLTKLNNRQAFDTKLANLFQKPDRLKTAAMLMFDIDELKAVNDKYGHAVGDQYIQCAAGILRNMEDDHILASHISGDEFTLLIYGMKDRNSVRKVIQELERAVQETSFILPDGMMQPVRISGGLAWYPDDAQDQNCLSRYADFAMYQEKKMRKGGIQEFDFATYYHDNLSEYQGELERLLSKRQIDCELQPILATRTGQTAAYRASMMPHSKILRSSAEVMAIARAHGRLYQVEQMTWEQALKEFQAVTATGPNDCKLFLCSVSGLIMSKEDYRELLQKYAPLDKRLVLELDLGECTDYCRSTEKMQMLLSMGVELGINFHLRDFERLALLEKIRPSYLLLNTDLIRGVSSSEQRQKLLREVVRFTEQNPCTTVALGVDTEEELRFIRDAGVQMAQGIPVSEAKPNGRAMI